jgi:hypothetical protein
MTREAIKATGWGTLVTPIVALLIVIGSRNLSYFDAALVGVQPRIGILSAISRLRDRAGRRGRRA